MKTSKRSLIILGLIVTFVCLQFIQPEKNDSAPGDNHIVARGDLPEKIKALLEESCFDCHSNYTRYPWYDNIAPSSWYVARHIREGKDKLNFSDWGKLEAFDKITSLVAIREQVNSGEMPLRSYLLLHRKAHLTKEQVKEISDWADKLSEQILNSEPEE